MSKISCVMLVAVVVLWSGASFADQIGDCTTTMKDGKVAKTKIYQKGGKTLIETEMGSNKSKVIKDESSVLLVMDAQKMCMKSPVPAPVTPAPGSATPSTNPDGSTTKCTWANATNPDSMFSCPAGYAMTGMMGK